MKDLIEARAMLKAFPKTRILLHFANEHTLPEAVRHRYVSHPNQHLIDQHLSRNGVKWLEVQLRCVQYLHDMLGFVTAVEVPAQPFFVVILLLRHCQERY